MENTSSPISNPLLQGMINMQITVLTAVASRRDEGSETPRGGWGLVFGSRALENEIPRLWTRRALNAAQDRHLCNIAWKGIKYLGFRLGSACKTTLKRPCRYHKHQKTKQTKWEASESIKNKNVGNTFLQHEENKTFFLAGPAAAISLANLLAQSSWEEQKVLKRRHGEVERGGFWK